MPKYGIFSGPYFPVFGLNTVIYGVNIRIQSEYRKIRAIKTPHLDTVHVVEKSCRNKRRYTSSSSRPFFKKKKKNYEVKANFGRPLFEHTIKVNRIKFQNFDPEILSVLILRTESI